MSGRHHDWPVKLSVDPTAFVAPGAIVVGEVSIGARSSIWFNTVVRGDSERIAIGADTNVQDNSTVHVDDGLPALIGDRVTVGHRAIVHGCVIEDDVLIGMGAVVLSGARVGAGSLIGASALVKENDVVPPGSLVLGAPAKVVGEVRESHRAAIRAGAEHYAVLARTYQQRGLAATTPDTARGAAAFARLVRPMDWMEWEQRLDVLRSGPAWASAALAQHGGGAFARKPAAGGWSALEVVRHLRDCDRDVLRPRLEAMLTEDLPAVSPAVEGWLAPGAGWADAAPEAAIAGWAAERTPLVRRLEACGPGQWQRPLLHPTRGAQTLADQVRYWTNHDLSHRRQVRVALEAHA